MHSLTELYKLCPQVESILESIDKPVVAWSYTKLSENSPLLKPRQGADTSAWAIGLGDQSYLITRIHKLGGWLSPATILESVKTNFPIGQVVVVVRSFKGVSVNVFHAQDTDMRDIFFKAYADNLMGD